MDIKDIEHLIAEIDEQLRPLMARKQELSNKLKEARSLEFIRVNKITKDMVQSSYGTDVPWMGDVRTFGKWLKVNSDKPWCEWNGSIYQTSEIIRGRMALDAVGRVSDLK